MLRRKRSAYTAAAESVHFKNFTKTVWPKHWK